MASGNAGYQTDCCILASQFDNISGIGGCLISANMSAKVEIIKTCGSGPFADVVFGPTVGSLSLTTYTYDTSIHEDCQGRAGVSIPWAKHYGCGIGGNPTHRGVFYIKTGSGSAFVAGNVGSDARLVRSTNRYYPQISISSQGGPTSIGTVIEQTDGAGLIYTGGPINFDSSVDDMIFNFTVHYDHGLINEFYLQSFNLEKNPGEIPTANYSFMFYIDD